MSKTEFRYLLEKAKQEQKAEKAGFSCFLDQEEKRKAVREARLREALALRKQALRKLSFRV